MATKTMACGHPSSQFRQDASCDGCQDERDERIREAAHQEGREEMRRVLMFVRNDLLDLRDFLLDPRSGVPGQHLVDRSIRVIDETVAPSPGAPPTSARVEVGYAEVCGEKLNATGSWCARSLPCPLHGGR